jgi:hypothetical protein
MWGGMMVGIEKVRTSLCSSLRDRYGSECVVYIGL